MVKEGTLRVQATNCASGFEVTTDGTGVVGHVGAALLRELADPPGAVRQDRHQASLAHHPPASSIHDLVLAGVATQFAEAYCE